MEKINYDIAIFIIGFLLGIFISFIFPDLLRELYKKKHEPIKQVS